MMLTEHLILSTSDCDTGQTCHMRWSAAAADWGDPE